MKKFFLGLTACAALCACSSDDLVSDASTQKTFEGDVAYMTVRLKDVGNGTRATSPTDEPFINSEEDEYAVSDAYFYFYDKDGVFVSEAEVWDGGTATDPNKNVEFKSETVIILKGLTGKSYPSHVVTILNKPTDFQPAETLGEMQTKLANASKVLYNKDEGGNFVMSTSSYNDGENDYYFTTPLSDEDFFEEPIPNNEFKAVDIYVERLAAKITVGVSSSMTAAEGITYTDEEGSSYATYEIDETVAGDPNEETAENTGVAAEKIYVAFLGWTTNAVARNSYMMKNLDVDAWTTSEPFTGWNDATNHRSYWGMSWNYGDEEAEYPTESKGNTDSDEANPSKWLNDYLQYKSLQTTTSLNSDGNLYCEYVGENTNTADVLESKYSSGITSVLLKAVACDENGNALDLVRYNGELFTEKAYLQYVMDYLTAKNKLNVYTKDENDVYTHIDSTYVKLSNEYTADGSTVTLANGLVAVVVKEGAFDGSKTFYKNEDGTYSEITETEPTVESTVTTALDEFNKDAEANAYTGGLMYYSIPIEHLNNTYGDDLAEANYGVVRNHCYSLTITSLSNMGKGIYNEEEVIVPDPEEAPAYYVGATINILSWKLVDQQVGL